MNLKEYRNFINAIGGPENFWYAFGRKALEEIRSKPAAAEPVRGNGRALLVRNRKEAMKNYEVVKRTRTIREEAA